MNNAKLWCPKCDSFCSPRDVDFESVPVRCVMCGTPSEVDDGHLEAEEPPKRRHIPVPDNFRVESDGHYLKISYRPREFWLPGLETLHEAIYLEQTIEEHLGIADYPVEGGISL